MLKPNQREAFAACRGKGRLSLAAAQNNAMALHRRARRPVFLTLGARGMLVANDGTTARVPGIRVAGPLDIVGAGDACSAAISAALAAGAQPVEAATIATLAASITVQQLGTTGTATPAQLRRRLQEVRRGL